MDFENSESTPVLEESTFRAAAFWRLLYQVWQLTNKNCPEAFPVGSLKDQTWDKPVPKHVEILLAMVLEMNTGSSARATFLTYDEAILADGTMMVIRAFSGMPTLFPKLKTLFMASSVGSTLLGTLNGKALSRSDEMLGLAEEFYNISRNIKGKGVNYSAKLTYGQLPDYNIYLTITINQA
jgi:hypothetical protein